MPNRRRKPSLPQQHGVRLLAILRANLRQATEPALRKRLERAIAAIKEGKSAA
jgi:type II secretory pathway component PulF